MNNNKTKNTAHIGVDILKYKGFIGTVNYSEASGFYYGKILNSELFSDYQGKTHDEIYELFRKTVDEYLAKDESTDSKNPFGDKNRR